MICDRFHDNSEDHMWNEIYLLFDRYVKFSQYAEMNGVNTQFIIQKCVFFQADIGILANVLLPIFHSFTIHQVHNQGPLI